MGYLKANTVLPARLLAEVQQYVDGACIYIPRAEGKRMAWGEASNSRQELDERNQAITARYSAGASVRQLAEEYRISEKAIYKVLSAKK